MDTWKLQSDVGRRSSEVRLPRVYLPALRDAIGQSTGPEPIS